MAVLIALLWSAALPFILAQSASPSNATQNSAPPGSEQIQIAPTFGGPPGYTIRINLTALTENAWSGISNNQKYIATPLLVNLNSQSSIQQTTSSSFALIECDPTPGNLQPIDVVKQAIVRNALAIILYSTASNYCALQTGTGVPDSYVIYSTTNPSDYQKLTRGTSNFSPTGSSNQWTIGKKSTLDNSTSTMSSNGQNQPNYSPGGPSPSTAVAMIILYSITGVITALFLVIIITGAVRAHRHPERYGPRNVLGRPRQSRARGLARAMLETLPIVKFGEKEDDPKTGDVEMADSSTAHARHVDETPSTTGAANAESTSGTHEDTATHSAEKSDSAEIAAVGAVSARKSPEPALSVDDDNLGCSICTEDFEKGQDVRVLPCKHQFHPACIDPWLLNVSGTCPLCRIDLRPVTSRENNLAPDSASATSDNLPPPLDADATGTSSHRASRRMSGFWEVLNPRRMQHATPEERLEALRRVREERGSNASEELETRRRRRLTARLGETFGVRTRARGISPSGSAEIPATVTENPASPTTATIPAASTTATGAGEVDVAHSTTEASLPTTQTDRSI